MIAGSIPTNWQMASTLKCNHCKQIQEYTKTGLSFSDQFQSTTHFVRPDHTLGKGHLWPQVDFSWGTCGPKSFPVGALVAPVQVGALVAPYSSLGTRGPSLQLGHLWPHIPVEALLAPSCLSPAGVFMASCRL